MLVSVVELTQPRRHAPGRLAKKCDQRLNVIHLKSHQNPNLSTVETMQTVWAIVQSLVWACAVALRKDTGEAFLNY